MKIGINASFARKPSNGTGQVTVNFLKKLAEFSVSNLQLAGEMEFILYLEEDLPEDIKLPENFQKRIFLPPWKRDDLIRKVWWEKFSLPRMAKADGCGVFLSLYQCPTIMPSGMRHIMLVHDIVPKFFPGYLNNLRKKTYWRLTEKAMARADKILAVSSRTEKDLVRLLGIDARKISVNYNGCDEIYKKEISEKTKNRILKKYGLKAGYIYNGGGLEVRKNAEGAIRAYKLLLESNKDSAFVREMPHLVVSGKLLPQLAPLVVDVEKLARELNLTGYVHILGFVPQEDLPAIYAGAEMFVYPSHYEGFGIPVLEAMSVGTPVITSKKSSLPEVGLDSVLYCDPDDVSDIAMVMKNVLTNPALRAMLARRGKERSAQFSWDKFTAKTLHILQEEQRRK